MIHNSGKKLVKNAGITFGTQLASLFLKFLLQKVFLDSLGVSYLGYNSVFSNILQMLNMADLGVGVAITSFLYKPIADNDTNRISALMYLYKKVYTIIGLFVALFGMVIFLLVPYIINDALCSDLYLRLLFFINLVGVVSTYFLAYKRTLIVAQQKSYFTNTIDFFVNFFSTIIQIILLIILPNYLIYLIVTVIKNIISNIIISIFCKKNNTYLCNDVNIALVDSYKKPIFLYVKDVFVAKVGSYIYYGTDNIIISTFKGSILAGYLSNYSLVTVALKSIITEVFSSLQATYGNLIVTSNDKANQRRVSDAYILLNYIVANVCFVCCNCIFQPFISLYIGAEYKLAYSTVTLLSINLGLTVLLIIPSQIFVVFKLYKYDKPIVAFSAILNILVSVLLVKKIGLNGVLIGTLITSLIYLFSRLYIISRKAFEVSYFYYFLKYVLFFIVSIISYYLISKACVIFEGKTFLSLILRVLDVGILSVFLSLTYISFTNDFNFIIEKIQYKRIRFFMNKYSLIIISSFMIIFHFLCIFVFHNRKV